MKVEQLKQLITIVQQGSINKAAQKLYIAHSSLSASMKSLEAELGSEIIDRTSKGITLTPFGSEVYNQAKMICMQFDFIQNISKTEEDAILPLSISNMYSPIANEIFINLYNAHSKDKVHLSINECSTIECISNVQSGLSEIGVITLFSNTNTMFRRSMQSKGISYQKLSNKRLFVVLGPKNPLYTTTKDSLNVEDLDDYAFSTYYDALTETSWRDLFSGQTRKKPDVSISTMECLSKLLSETDVFTIDVYNPMDLDMVPYYKNLRFIPLNHCNFNAEYGWICKEDKALSPLAKEYVAHLKNRVDEILAQGKM